MDGMRPQLLAKIESEIHDEKKYDARFALMMYDIISKTLDSVRFVVTYNGYVGLVPPTPISHNDVIVMIRGARIPLLLRPLDYVTGEFALIGSCYVFGMMDWVVRGDYKAVHIH